MTETSARVALTRYSHGAGCGCKIAPALLAQILRSDGAAEAFPRLLVGYGSRDDAAVFDLGDGRSVISTTDFFMPIVDDPFTFGRIAATNAISDVYAMGGTPLMAISIFGWPIDKLAAEVASAVIEGGRAACREAGIPLAGGHSIDAPEPIFGLAVTGEVRNEHLKRNDRARAGCRLYLTKPLGIGILTTAEKQRRLRPEHQRLAVEVMCRLNRVGSAFAGLEAVTAMTDVTGFGLLGHLLEICEGSGLSACIDYAAVPRLEGVDEYLAQGCSPGGTQRNFDSYGHKLAPMDDTQRRLLCDPQTSGGLLVAVAPEGEAAFLRLAREQGLELAPIGRLQPARDDGIVIEVV